MTGPIILMKMMINTHSHFGPFVDFIRITSIIATTIRMSWITITGAISPQLIACNDCCNSFIFSSSLSFFNYKTAERKNRSLFPREFFSQVKKQQAPSHLMGSLLVISLDIKYTVYWLLFWRFRWGKAERSLQPDFQMWGSSLRDRCLPVLWSTK